MKQYDRGYITGIVNCWQILNHGFVGDFAGDEIQTAQNELKLKRSEVLKAGFEVYEIEFIDEILKDYDTWNS